MGEAEAGEARGAERKRVLKGAKIAFAARCATLPCVVRDLSETGARLQVKDHLSVPETFELLIELDGFEVDAEVVWRRDSEVGIVFLDRPRIKNPTRHQIVGSSVPKSRGTLRRLDRPVRRQPHAAPINALDESEMLADQERTEAGEDVSDALSAAPLADIVDAAEQACEAAIEEIDTPPSADASEYGNAPDVQDEPAADGTVLEGAASEIRNAEVAATVGAEDVCDEQVAALVASLETLEMVAGEAANASPSADAGTAVADDAVSETHAAEDARTECGNAFETPLPVSEFADEETPSMVSVDNNADARNDSEVEPREVSDAIAEENQQPAAERAPSCVGAAPVEAPMFRDVAAASAQTTQAADETLAPPPSAPAIEAAPPVFAARINDRISTALQAPARAAENIGRVLAPIIPAPSVSEIAETPREQSDEEQVSLTEAEHHEADSIDPAAGQTGDAQHGDERLADDADTVEATVNAPVNAPVEVPAETPPTEASLRPELASFISLFAASAQPESVPSGAPETAEPADEAHSSMHAEPADQAAEDINLHAIETPMSRAVTAEAPAESRADDAPAAGTGQADTCDQVSSDAQRSAVTAFETALQHPDSRNANPSVTPPTAPTDGFYVISDEAIAFGAAPIGDTTDRATEGMAEPFPPRFADAVIDAPLPEPVFATMEMGAFPAPAELPEPYPEPEFKTEFEQEPKATDTGIAEISFAEMLPCPDEDDDIGPVVTPRAEVDCAPPAAPLVVSPAVPSPTTGVIEHDAAGQSAHRIPILIAEDDPDDRMFMREAFEDSDFDHDIAFVEDGEQLLDYLRGVGDYAGAPRPGMILLDLNMPKMDGRTALLHIKSNPSLRR
ncbi:MAG: response regulator, partial [Pseudomonadota bacterium]